jgi:superfamily II DNA or RNA helicase
MLFSLPAFGLAEEREERKRTINERCEFAAQLVHHDQPAVIWCHTNAEADLLERLIPDAAQVAGRTPDARKVELYEAFASGTQRVLIIKPKIGAWGLNWQHCAHVVTFASHSYEQYYQSVRRCWRFGQQRPVQLDVIATDGEARVLANMRAKSDRASKMFEELVAQMNHAATIKRTNDYTTTTALPQWL